MRPSHTDGATTAPASIRSSAHAARVKCCSRNGSKLSPKEPVAIPSSPPSFSSALHDNSAGYSANSCRRPSTSLSWMRAAGFGYGPLESSAQTLFYFFNQVLPAWKPIFARQHQLGITL